jgi:hypothetical protein
LPPVIKVLGISLFPAGSIALRFFSSRGWKGAALHPTNFTSGVLRTTAKAWGLLLVDEADYLKGVMSGAPGLRAGITSMPIASSLYFRS